MEYINIKFKQKGFLELMPIEYKIGEHFPLMVDFRSDICKITSGKSFDQNAIQCLLAGGTVESDDGDVIYANISENGCGYELVHEYFGGTDIYLNKVFPFNENDSLITLTYDEGEGFSVDIGDGHDSDERFCCALKKACGMTGVDYDKTYKIFSSLKDFGSGNFSLCGGYYWLDVSVQDFWRGCCGTETGIIQQKVVPSKLVWRNHKGIVQQVKIPDE